NVTSLRSQARHLAKRHRAILQVIAFLEIGDGRLELDQRLTNIAFASQCPSRPQMRTGARQEGCLAFCLTYQFQSCVESDLCLRNLPEGGQSIMHSQPYVRRRCSLCLVVA